MSRRTRAPSGVVHARRRPRWSWLSLILVLGACGEEGLPAGPAAGVDGAARGVPDAVVRPGQSIQAAIDAAAPGDRIFIAPGTYSEALTIDKPHIRLVGLGSDEGQAGRVVLTNPGDARNGIRVGANAVEIRGLTIRDFDRNGILLVGVDGFHLRGIVTENNGAYGLFPVRSRNGLIEDCVASGHADTGIYIGQSEDVVIRNSVAFGNVNGFEIENSSRVQAVDNEAFGNTAGFLVALLPFLTVKESAHILVARNEVRDNNLPNFAPPGGFESVVPAGSGILVVGGTDVTVEANQVTGHDFVGVAVGSVAVLAALADIPPEALDVDPDPRGVRVRANVVTGNGGAQPIPFLPPGVDLLWDGTGTDNCWEENEYETSLPSSLPTCV